jgi:asparagine synthase (glutamine-hydrolysing)
VCGIVGKVYRDRIRPVEHQHIARMKAAIRHRGPDSDGSWFFPSVGLGCQRLAIIDLTTGDQPMFNEDRTIAIVSNGEIYNHLDLRNRLIALGHFFSTRSDTEVIVHGYEQWGIGVVEKLRGMFAFAIFDTRLHQLFMARDRFGKKPLYFAKTRNGSTDEALIFGSELKALLADIDVPRHLDYSALDHYLTYGYVPEPLCMIDGVSKLPPAHWLTYRQGELTIERYWTFDYEPKIALGGTQAVRTLYEKMDEAVRLRLNADVKLGSFLSSGLDSSTIVSLAARHVPGRLQTFSAALAGAKNNELDAARNVARHFGTEHHELLIRPNAAEALAEIPWLYGEPNAHLGSIAFIYVHRWVAEHVKVILSGDGGDETFVGYEAYHPRQSNRWWDHIPRVWRRKLMGPMRKLAASRPSNLRLIKTFDRCRKSLMNDSERFVRHWTLFQDYLRDQLLAPDLKLLIHKQSNRSENLMESLMLSEQPSALVDRMMRAEWRMHMPGITFPQADRIGMAYGLEIRSPFCDHELAEFVAKLPVNIKSANGELKSLLKNTMRPHLPPFLFGTRKIGFGAPGPDFFGLPLWRLAEEMLFDSTTRNRGLFDQRSIGILIKQHVTQQYNHRKRLWSLLILEAWFRTFIDPPDPLASPLDFSSAEQGGARAIHAIRGATNRQDLRKDTLLRPLSSQSVFSFPDSRWTESP